MTFAGSVTQLIEQAKTGDETAFAAIHRRYWPQIVAIAASRLSGARPMPADADDVAQRAFIDLHLSFQNGRIPNLTTRHQLLALMSHIVACKALNEIRDAQAKRRGGQTRTVEIGDLLADDQATGPLQQAILKDCCDYYVNGLPENLRKIAHMHLAGLTNREIAEKLGCVVRTVERKIELLRIRWQQMMLAEMGGELSAHDSRPDQG